MKIPHGITSCLTLAPVIHLKAETSENAEIELIARVLAYIDTSAFKPENPQADAHKVGDRVTDLVNGLGLKSSLGEVYRR